MNLSQILYRVKTDFQVISNGFDLNLIEIADIALDSRLVQKNSGFFALDGVSQDGSKFIDKAIESGANLIIAKPGQTSSTQCLIIESSNPFQLLTEFLQIFYQPLPSNIYAITGTNGKTSTAEFTRHILQFLGKKSASIGTLGVVCEHNIEQNFQNSSLTTPDLVSLYKNLQILKSNNIDDVAIEVSSIGLDQSRIAGLKIDVGAFTNLTQDHLDYHKSMAEYLRCKMILFDDVLSSDSIAVINSDIAEFAKIKQICAENKIKIIEYGFKAKDLRLQKIEQIKDGQKVFFEFRQKDYQFNLTLGGDFQAFNVLCALGNILAKNNLTESQLEDLLQNFDKLPASSGRMQKVGILPNKAQVFIDFAHSPDALQNVLNLAKEVKKGRLLVLFGCGGDRDAKKRPIMAEIACDLADFVIITDDNPRCENPEVIRAQIMQNCVTSKAIEINGRKQAIETAINMLEPDDTLILAGKGHEKYQIIGKEKFEFDEEKIVKNAIKQLS